MKIPKVNKALAVAIIVLSLVIGAIACSWIFNGGVLRFRSDFNFELKTSPDIIIIQKNPGNKFNT